MQISGSATAIRYFRKVQLEPSELGDVCRLTTYFFIMNCIFSFKLNCIFLRKKKKRSWTEYFSWVYPTVREIYFDPHFNLVVHPLELFMHPAVSQLQDCFHLNWNCFELPLYYRKSCVCLDQWPGSCCCSYLRELYAMYVSWRNPLELVPFRVCLVWLLL